MAGQFVRARLLISASGEHAEQLKFDVRFTDPLAPLRGSNDY
ncbi:hypothetical protein [Burkholderia metallica]|nr:hypothetical protein [Burkholderia metallica]